MPRVTLTDSFLRAYKQLPLDKQKRISKALGQFVENERYPSLRFEKLKGSDNSYSIRASLSDRILLRLIGNDTYEATDVGSHAVYQSMKR